MALKVTRFPNGIQAPITDKTDGSELTPFTDNSGGTVSSTIAAIAAGASYAQADMVAVKNALASIVAQLNKINGT